MNCKKGGLMSNRPLAIFLVVVILLGAFVVSYSFINSNVTGAVTAGGIVDPKLPTQGVKAVTVIDSVKVTDLVTTDNVAIKGKATHDKEDVLGLNSDLDGFYDDLETLHYRLGDLSNRLDVLEEKVGGVEASFYNFGIFENVEMRLGSHIGSTSSYSLSDCNEGLAYKRYNVNLFFEMSKETFEKEFSCSLGWDKDHRILLFKDHMDPSNLDPERVQVNLVFGPSSNTETKIHKLDLMKAWDVEAYHPSEIDAPFKCASVNPDGCTCYSPWGTDLKDWSIAGSDKGALVIQDSNGIPRAINLTCSISGGDEYPVTSLVDVGVGDPDVIYALSQDA